MNDLKTNQQDEFQFKPLTKGLGFHPKKESSTQSLNVQHPTPQAPHNRSLRLDTPLPRPEVRKTPMPSTANQTVDTILKNLNDKNKSLNFQDKGQSLSPYLQTAPSLSAGFLDLLLVTALSLLYFMTLIFTLKLDLLVKFSVEGGNEMFLSTASVFLVVGFVYYVAQRMFFGFTLGEWAYEQRLGLPEEMKKSTYGLKVLYRQVLIIATGVIIIPLISWALGRDLAGVSGLCTYRKR